MKKHLFILLFLLSFTFTESLSQAHKPSGFGVRVGANFSNFSGHGDQVTLNVGPTAGIYYRLGITDVFKIQPELMYSMLGGRFVGSEDTINDRLNYLNLPILAQFWIYEGLNAHVGPYAALLFNTWSSGRSDLDLSADYQSWDYGVVAGVGYELPFGLNFSFRYNLGLSDIVDDRGLTGAGGSVYNRFYQLLIGFTF